jgi:hypothetical protein
MIIPERIVAPCHGHRPAVVRGEDQDGVLPHVPSLHDRVSKLALSNSNGTLFGQLTLVPNILNESIMTS